METIEVLNTVVGPSNMTAWEGEKNVLCANVTIIPGNNSVDNYLKAITFNATAETTLSATYIESFGLWNDSNANKIFEPAADKMITSSLPTEGSNVTFYLTDLPVDNRTILPEGGTFFLTINITETAHTGNYTAQIFAQNITINQTAGEGNSSHTTGFTTLWIDPADVRVYDDTPPIEYIAPEQTYVAYNITYYENVSDATSANLTWFNVTGMNQSVSGIGDISNITNVSVWNSTSWTYIGHNATRLSTSPYFTVNLSNIEVDNNSTYNLTIMFNPPPPATIQQSSVIPPLS
ncbi:MAG: hypothetical protein QMD80_08250 [archaeon]|nr:hypothetical protein [archaeon]